MNGHNWCLKSGGMAALTAAAVGSMLRLGASRLFADGSGRRWLMEGKVKSCKRFLKSVGLVLSVTLLLVGLTTRIAMASEPIVGLWQITATDSHGAFLDSLFTGWTSDGLEFDQDISPILTGYVCYGPLDQAKGSHLCSHAPFLHIYGPEHKRSGTESTEGFSMATRDILITL